MNLAPETSLDSFPERARARKPQEKSRLPVKTTPNHAPPSTDARSAGREARSRGLPGDSSSRKVSGGEGLRSKWLSKIPGRRERLNASDREGNGEGGAGENGTDLRGSNGKSFKKGGKKPASGSSQENQAASSREKKSERKRTPVLSYRTWLS